MLSAAITAKVEDGNIKAAIRILCSATDVKASYEKEFERHPDPPFERGTAQPPDDIPAIQVSETEVILLLLLLLFKKSYTEMSFNQYYN